MLSFDLLAESSVILCTFALRMKKFRIEVTEVLRRIVDVEAESETEAIDTVWQMYRNCDVVLDASDYVETEISAKR